MRFDFDVDGFEIEVIRNLISRTEIFETFET